MFRVFDTKTNTNQYFNHVAHAFNYCIKTNGKIDNYLEGETRGKYESLQNKYVVVTNEFHICNTLEEAMKLKDYHMKNTNMCAINVAKIEEGPHLDWESYTNPIYDRMTSVLSDSDR